jgi:hypothetical protein
MVDPKIREWVIEIQNAHITWTEFEKALLEEYMLEGASRMTRHTLMNCIERKGKNVCVSGAYAEFDQLYNQLPSADQHLLDGDKVLLFLKAVDVKDRLELGNLLEDETQTNGLVSDWTLVKKTCNHLDKGCQWLEETDVENVQAPRRTTLVTTVPSKEMNGLDKKTVGESIIEELSKKFEAVSLANMGR